ncbi:hydroxymethylpyrimidine/phosphomethylpyrimidine kinase [Flavobacterium sp. PL12]|uniref:hydroxymethylpyrimidine/phosphomethylpyrimidine kinase n=1 Tax=Flavobacterium sp. PL12 TaxID=3071718 RepID=UPI00319DB44F
MPTNRPFVLTIAGFDPSAGAGILADIKTFEQHHVYGLAISTANTIQTDTSFKDIQWTDLYFVLRSIETLFNSYAIKAVKIGIVPSLEYLKAIVFLLKELSPNLKIVWDTVLKSTTTFEFLKIEDETELLSLLDKIEIITPNYDEILKLGKPNEPHTSINERLAKNCAILLKGGHNPNQIGIDYLTTKEVTFKLPPKTNKIHSKHGSGCVLSAAIVANLALKQNLFDACVNAKNYTEKFLLSNTSKLGYHYAQ